MVTYKRDATATADLIKRNGVDALEIHTSGRYFFGISLNKLLFEREYTISLMIEEWMSSFDACGHKL